MKKVLMLLDNPLRSDARVEKEAKALVKAGFNVTVLTTVDLNLPEIELRDGYLICRKIKPSFTKPFGKKYSLFVKETVSMICKYEFDYLHCHDFYMLDLGVNVKIKNPNIKLFYDAHEFLAGWPFYLANKGWWNKVKGFIVWKKLIINEKKGIESSDYMLTITESIADQFFQKYHLSARPIVIGNYPEIDESIKEPMDLKGYLSIPKDHYLLIHSGSIYHTDAELIVLFDVIQRNQKLHLAFVGNRPRFEEVKTLVLNQNLSRIYFIDYPKDQTEVIQLLSGADIGLLHIRQQWLAHKLGFSNRFVEYLNAGLAVVATPQEFTKSINQIYPCCKFYKTSDKNSLESAITEAMIELNILKLNSKNSQKELTWKFEKRKFVNFYKDLKEEKFSFK